MRTFVIDTLQKVGKQVTLKGWVNSVRSHGGIVFIDLRDFTGVIQLVASKEQGAVGLEDVIEVTGIVKTRPENLVNPKIPTGKIEVEIQKLIILNRAKELPFPIDTEGYEINEELRNKYRYLDIRRPRMIRNLRLRSQVTTFIRNYLTERKFVEIETPLLTKTTPEGARDFIVPSRLQKGKFYALPQSPQQYKQLLMVAGLERYFQIVRCFRDEDPRADRAYGEFTQLDMEMSFIGQNDILTLVEEMFTQIVKTVFPEKRILITPWPRIPHVEAKTKYGSDKPDLRKNKKDADELAFTWIMDFPLFTRQTKEDYYFGSGAAKFAPSHHMFTAPHPEDVALLDTDPLKVRGLQHDLVLNGFEIGGGSIRIHDPSIQEKIFDLIGFTDKQKQQFSHMLTAFTYGVPPHGGIAPGIDRFMMAVLGEPSVREVMAFPTSASGQTSVMDAPSEATAEQLQELGLQHAKSQKIDVFSHIKHLLDSANVAYQVYEHEPVYTSEQAAKIRQTALYLGAKALVLFADNHPVMVVVPADRKLDMQKYKLLYNVKNLRMAKPSEVEEITGVKVGAVPPLGSIFNIPLYVDKQLRRNPTLVFNAGLHTKSISLSTTDYKKVARPIVGDFSRIES